MIHSLLICFAVGLPCYNVSFAESPSPEYCLYSTQSTRTMSVQSTVYIVHNKNELEEEFANGYTHYFIKSKLLPAASEAEDQVILATAISHSLSFQPAVLSWVPERSFARTCPSTCTTFFLCMMTGLIAIRPRVPPPPHTRFRIVPPEERAFRLVP